MQNFKFNFINNFEVVLEKTSLKLLFIMMFFSGFLFANDINSEKNETPHIVVFGNTVIYNSEPSEIKEINTKNEQGEIFVSNGTILYNEEALKNAKITKPIPVKKTAISKTKKKISKKDKTTESIKIYPLFKYNNSTEKSSIFFQNQKEKIVLLQNRKEALSKAIVTKIIANKKAFIKQKAQIIYKNPSSINVCYFSGKYSIRPPTFYI